MRSEISSSLGAAALEFSISIIVVGLLVSGVVYLGRTVSNLIMVEQIAYSGALSGAMVYDQTGQSMRDRIDRLVGFNSTRIPSLDGSKDGDDKGSQEIQEPVSREVEFLPDRMISVKLSAPLFSLPISWSSPRASSTMLAPQLTQRSILSNLDDFSFQNPPATMSFDCNGARANSAPTSCYAPGDSDIAYYNPSSGGGGGGSGGSGGSGGGGGSSGGGGSGGGRGTYDVIQEP